MRDVVLQMQMTLDGFIGGPNGEVEWAFPQFDPEFETWTVSEIWRAGVHVMGGETGRGLAEYWPKLDTMDLRDKPYAAAMNEIPKVIFSRTLDSVDWNATRIAKGDLYEEIQSLKQPDDGKTVLVHCGARFVQSLSRLRLIDEYHLVVHPLALGEGLRLFPEMEAPLKLKLIEVRAFPAGAALHIYRLA